MLQSLKETFADKIPGEIEKVKKLRKYVPPILLSNFFSFYPVRYRMETDW